MINILSYVGMNMQSEVCLWCLLGLVRTIFDATLFKVNANLKQVWQMTMPEELSMPVQRVLRTMVSGVMLVQCFTVYVYLASYIVLLYPVFLEERPTLVLPWLLLAAVRKLLCELTSLALGLGTCVLLGPARPPCIKFVVVKFSSIMPAFYMWMLVFSYYHALKVASAFKTFPAVLPPSDNDYGLELAVRRRRTKSLLGEAQLRKKLVAHFYGERTSSTMNETYFHPLLEISSRMVHSTDTSIEEEVPEADVKKPSTISTAGWSDIGAYEDWFGNEVMIPRDTDRILEQIVLMLLRIGAYLKKEGKACILDSQKLNPSTVPESWHQHDNMNCATINADVTDTPPLVGSSRGNMASYLREYPQIFMKKKGADNTETERTIASLKTVYSHVENDESNISKNKAKRNSSSTSSETISSVEVERVLSKNPTILDINTTQENKTVKLTLPSQLQLKVLKNTDKSKKQRNVDRHLQNNSLKNTDITDNKLQESKTLTNDLKKSWSESKHLYENKSVGSTDKQISNEDSNKNNARFTTLDGNHKKYIEYKKMLNIEYKPLYEMSNSNRNIKHADTNTILHNGELTLHQISDDKNNEEFSLRRTNGHKHNDPNIGKISNEVSVNTVFNATGEYAVGQILNDNIKKEPSHHVSDEDYCKNLIPVILEDAFKLIELNLNKYSNNSKILLCNSGSKDCLEMKMPVDDTKIQESLNRIRSETTNNIISTDDNHDNNTYSFGVEVYKEDEKKESKHKINENETDEISDIELAYHHKSWDDKNNDRSAQSEEHPTNSKTLKEIDSETSTEDNSV